MPNDELLALRKKVDAIDQALVQLLAKRFTITAEIGQLKSRDSLDPIDPSREATQVERYKQLALENGINPVVVVNVFRVVIDEVVRQHRGVNHPAEIQTAMSSTSVGTSS